MWGSQGSDVENGQHVSVSGPAPDFLWLRDGVQGMGRTPGLPEANTILDGEGHGADGQANTIKPLAQKNKQSLPTRICRCYFSFRDMTFPLVVKCLGSSSLHRCYRNKASKTCCWGEPSTPILISLCPHHPGLGRREQPGLGEAVAVLHGDSACG